MTSWIEIGALNDIPVLGSRIVRTASGDIAVFRTADDEVFALDDRCPHKGGPLSQGIVHNKRVTCPLHNFVIELRAVWRSRLTRDVRARIRPRWRTTPFGCVSRQRRPCPPSEGDRPCQ